MKHLYYIAFCVVFLQFSVRAQNSFKPGYIVSAKGDTTKGLINYSLWRKNTDQITFKKDASSPITNYSKDTTPAFGVVGYGNFHLLPVKLRKYTSAVGDQVNFADTSFITSNTYLAEVVLGKKVSLYSYEDGNKTHFFTLEGSSSPRELTGYGQINYETFSKVVEVDTYKKQLLQLAALYQPGNTLITEQIGASFYKLSDIKPIIIAVNGNDITYVEKIREKNRFFIGVGVNATAMKFTGVNHIYYPSGNIWSYLPQINAGMDLFSDKDAMFMFRGEMNLSATQNEFTYTNTVFGGTTTYTYKNVYSRFIVSINPQVLYNFYNNNKVKAFIAGGPKMDLNLNPKNKFTATSVGPGTVNSTGQDVPISPVYFNFTAKAGIKIDRFQIYGAYVTPFKIYDQAAAGAMVNTCYNFGINYFLGK